MLFVTHLFCRLIFVNRSNEAWPSISFILPCYAQNPRCIERIWSPHDVTFEKHGFYIVVVAEWFKPVIRLRSFTLVINSTRDVFGWAWWLLSGPPQRGQTSRDVLLEFASHDSKAARLTQHLQSLPVNDHWIDQWFERNRAVWNKREDSGSHFRWVVLTALVAHFTYVNVALGMFPCFIF